MNKFWKPALLVAAVVVMAIGMLGSGAWFGDEAQSPSSELYSGTLSLENDQFAYFNLGTIENMAPGDKTNRVSVYIKNDGSIPLSWFGDLVVSGSDKLKDAIYIDYAKMEFLRPDGTTPWYPADEFINNGVYKYGTGLNGPFGSVSLSKWDNNGDMVPGTPYEFEGYLEPTFMYKLTLGFGFSEGANNDYAGKGPLSISLKVNATQKTLGALQALDPAIGQGILDWMNLWPACQQDGECP